MITNDQIHKTLLTVALGGMTTGVLAETLGEMAKELRRYAGRDFDKCLDALEAKAVRSVENAATEPFPEQDQLFLAEQTRKIVRAKFKDIRDGT